jgi:hypothetical protein
MSNLRQSIVQWSGVSAIVAACALVVSLYSLYLTHQATGAREHRKWVRETALPLVAKLHETTIRFLRDDEAAALQLEVRIRRNPTPEDKQLFAEMQESLDATLFDIRTTLLQLQLLAGRKLQGLLKSQRGYVEELTVSRDDRDDIYERIRATHLAILESAEADLGMTGGLGSSALWKFFAGRPS